MNTPKNTIKGVSPEAETVTNQNGGMQSKTEYAFHLCDPDAMLALAETLQIGASKYARDNWRKIPSEEHFNHLVIHYYAWLKGDKSDNHLSHMFCRAMMLYAVGAAEEQENKTKEKKMESKDSIPGSSVVNNEALYNHYAKLGKLYNIDYCICCGDPLPEGRQVCYKCEKTSIKDGENGRQIESGADRDIQEGKGIKALR